MASGDSSTELEQSSKLTDVLSNKLNYDNYMDNELPDDLTGAVVPAVNATEEDSILRQGLFDADHPTEDDTYLNEEDVKDLDNVGDGEISNQALESLEDIANEDPGGDSDWDGEEDEEEDLEEDEDEGSEEDEDEDGEEGEESDDSEILDEENLDKLEDELGEVDKEINEHDKELEGEETAAVSMETTDPDLPSTSSKPASTSTKKRKRKKDKKDKSKKKLKGSKPNYKRKNIRKIIKETDLDKETIDAQNEEFERKKRLNELKKNVVPKPIKEEKDSELKSLLQAAEDEAEEASMNNDVIILDKKDVEKEEEREVIELSSEDEDEEEVSIVQTEDDLIEEEDMNNAGSHINDDANCPDELGRVLVNLSHPPADPDVFLSPQIARAIKPHQIGGIRFLYDNVVECLERHESTPGFGCILAHSMGLGKTLQMIGFIDIYLSYTKAKKALCIVPINTLQNWLGEFNMWSPDPSVVPPEMLNDVHPRSYKVFLLNDNYKSTATRAKVIAQWKEEGGVLLMGYEMYRLLSSKKAFAAKPKKSKKINQEPEVIDVDEEDKNKSLMFDIFGALVNPGPDIVICDEGHRIKNSHAGISQSLKNIKTRRRVVLTGYPLQNNLQEYWCMVDFVRPNFLGTKTEFSNMFERPMSNGLCVDSTDKDLRLMRHRAYVLHSLLEGFVQRRGHAVLNHSLPEKKEYVFMIRMSPIQRALYNRFMSTISDTALGSWANNNPLKSFSVCCKIWNHPDVLHKIVTQRKLDDDDLDLEGNEQQGGGKRKSKVKDTTDGMITYDWADELMKDYVPGVLEHSGKMVFLNSIIEESLAVGDKLLIFSQSLFTLNLIEEYLSQRNVPRPDMNEKWCKNRSYFRLDGSTSAQEREKLIVQFNQPNNISWLFLLSTRAGCLGINLIGANRVVVFDASWNPCHDCQAVCRVFRFGQKKNSYIYRLVTDNTLERKIYDRQVSKQKMSDRVIDDLNPDNMRRGTNDLLQYSDRDFPEVEVGDAFEDSEDVVMKTVLHKQSKWITGLPFTHESLLLDRRELRLSKREKQLAKEGYARDKKMSVSYSRPSYSAFYPNSQGLPILRNQQGMMVNRGGYMRPVASVKPMISTPVPMGLKTGAKGSSLGSNIMRPGVSVHQVITTTEIVLPGSNTATQAGTVNRIPPGQKVLVIKTLKGVYIRTADKKLFAVRSKGLPGPSMAPPGPLNLSSSSLTTLSSTQSTGLPISSTSASSTPSNLNIKIITSSGASVGKLGDKKLIINRNNNSATVKAMPKIIRAPSKSPITSELLQNDLLSSIYSQTDSVNAILRNQDSNSSDSTTPSSEKSGETTVTTVSQTTSTSSIANSVSGKLDKLMGPVNTNPFGSIIDDGNRGKLGAPFSLNFGKGVKPVGISKPATVTSNKSSSEDEIMSGLLSEDEPGNHGNKTTSEAGTNTTIARLPVLKPKPTTEKSPKLKPESVDTTQTNDLPTFPGQNTANPQSTKSNESIAITSSGPNFTSQNFNPFNFGIQNSNSSNFSNPGLNFSGNNPSNSTFGQNSSTFGYQGQNASFGQSQGFSGQAAGFQNFPVQNQTASNFQGQSAMSSNFHGQKTSGNSTFGSTSTTIPSGSGATYSYPNQNTNFPQDSYFNQGNKDNNSESTSELLNLCNQYNSTDSLGLANLEDVNTNQNIGKTPTDNSQANRANNSNNTGETTQPNTTRGNTNQDTSNVNNSMSSFNQSFNNMDSSSTQNQNFNNYGNNYNPMSSFGNFAGNNFGSNMSNPMVDQSYGNPYSNMTPNPFFPYFPQHNYPPMMGQPPGMGMMGGMPMMGGFNPAANMMSGIPQQMMPGMSTPSSTGASNTTNQSESNNQQSSSQVPIPQSMYGMPYMNSPINPFMYNSSPNSMYGMPMMNPFSSMATQQMNSIPHGMNSGMTPNSSGEQTDNLQSGTNPTSSAN